MGSPPDEEQRSEAEGPQRRVTIPQPFAMVCCPVTFAEWDAAVAAGGVEHKPGDERWGAGTAR
jgi:formylglycine-generating enzyme required for sulfatase activity